MEGFLKHTFNIASHPIGLFKPIYQRQYTEGLAEILSYISCNDPKVKLLYGVWVFSILKTKDIPKWGFSNKNLCKAKVALSLKREGISFFSMKQSFIFDCFYLLSISNIKYIDEAYNVFRHHLCGIFTRFVTLTDIYLYFCGKKNEKSLSVPEVLLNHRRLDYHFCSKPAKKILVVATMNAGKSTLINAITGYPINKTQNSVCTKKIRYIFNKPISDGLITKCDNNIYRYSSTISLLNDNVSYASFHFKTRILKKKQICLIDSPGINANKHMSHAEITLREISRNEYDLIVFVSNCRYFATDDENSLLEFTIKHSKKPIIYVLNQLDCFNPENDSISEMINDYKSIIVEKGGNPIIVPLSAYAAQLFKSDYSQLKEYEKKILPFFIEKFSCDYYDLENYAILWNHFSAPKEDSLLYKTGIEILEHLIEKT